ncbi:MAG TPA: DUF2189 domain-containing protein [Hyphomicrobiaceae bacterium]|nr:DUF2189 domain-containing protein [Hyphomicrobiaceae bacterium]
MIATPSDDPITNAADRDLPRQGGSVMAHADVILPTNPTQHLPVVCDIGLGDLRYALTKGFEDFSAMPTHAIFLSLIYPIVGLALGGATFGYNVMPLLYPLASGFALIGPFAAIGLYELSRRRELGLDTSWQHVFDIAHSPSLPAILALGFLLLVIFCVWLGVADAIYVANFGDPELVPMTLGEFVRRVVSTDEGQTLIIVGNSVGFLFAALAFSLSVISFPLLLDRNVGVAVAIVTSVRAIARNPLTMTLWAIFVVGALVIGSLPFLLGLAVVMPVLGHSTWHLYRRVIAPDSSPRPEYHPQAKGRRYAADFPVSLFVPGPPDERGS